MATMTPGERRELKGAINGRQKIAYSLVEARKAELIAELTASINKVYSPRELGIEDDIAEFEAQVRKLNLKVAQKMRARDRENPLIGRVLSEIDWPSAHFDWSGAGAVRMKERRAALIKAGTHQIEAMASAARLAIDQAIQQGHEMLVRDALESSAAVAFLDGFPTPAQLMPRIDVTTLRIGRLTSADRREIRAAGYDKHDD